jgi:hypothetical protein
MFATQEHDMPPGRPKSGQAGHSGHSYSSEEVWDWTIVQQRRAFVAMAPRDQEETRQRVIELLLDEVRRHQRQPSVLMRLARRVYGVDI